MNTDRIEKTIVLRAPRPTAWRALTTAYQFGAQSNRTLQLALALKKI